MSLLVEGGEYRGESGKTYLAVGPLGQANVWTAVEKENNENIVVLKAPASDDTGTSWPLFQHEMIMHELLKNCRSVRKQVDRISPNADSGSPPILVLEIFETTLWHARTKRPFTKEEVRSVARQILQGLKSVHDQGLVYADLKMQNVMLNGFDTTVPGDGSKLEVKLGDLGIVMQPSKGTVQPVAYRAPEVFFKGEITPAVDVWAFGLVYCHLMEAINRFERTGLYDDLYVGGGSMREREQAMRNAIGNDYDLQNNDYYKNCALPYRDDRHEPGQQWDELRKRGLDEEDVEFLQFILASDPRRRPSAADVLETKILGGEGLDDAQVQSITSIPQDPTGHLMPQIDGLSEQHTFSAGNSGGSAQRLRRDAGSISRESPGSIDLPPRRDSLQRGTSQSVSTPGMTSPGGAQTPALPPARRQDGIDDVHGGVRAHPLVRSAVQAGMDESQPEGSRLKTVDNSNEGLSNSNGGGVPSTMSNGTNEHKYARPEPNNSNGLAANAGQADAVTNGLPEPSPSYLGQNGSSGGTYLSYR
ncbi:hypothetical protein LTR86_005215 [Recurvomyces mirabilis]|nr:hypothetical protein LTR86_005215 [Recurvomyces mirabilis]